MRYRAAAWRAFDTDLTTNLETLHSALMEEVKEAKSGLLRSEDHAPPATSSRDSLKTAAAATLDNFRLNGLYAEVRGGPAAETFLARIPGAGMKGNEGLLDEAAWPRLGPLSRAQVLRLGDRRAVVRRFPSVPGDGVLTLLVADRTTLVEQTLASIRRALIEFGTVGLLLALAGGYWLATRALAPIDTLTSQAGRMAETASTPAPFHRLEASNLDDELGRLASTFNLLLERIESSVAQLRDFVADAAHELKTPIAIIRTEAELSLSGERRLEDYRESLGAIAAESARLSRVVSDLTLLAEGQTFQHPVERRLVDLNELMHEVRRSLRSVAASRGVTLDVDSSDFVEYRGDERLLRQIFTNLVENAIKFSPQGARVGIGLSAPPGLRQLRVVDEAPTLSREDRERVFERFYRSAQARGADATGSGLGLAIVQWAVQLHGGRIYIEPRDSGGNVFIVELPAPAAVRVA